MNGLRDLKQLRAFVQVAESGSISSAARVLGVAQSSLSRQLQGLEASIGLPLIRRDTHNMSLTEAGRILMADARRMLALADRVNHKLRAEQNFVHGHLRIVSVVDVGQWIISRVLARFRSIHPHVTAELHLINRPTRFIEEGFDCGFLVGEPLDSSLVVRRIGTLPRVLVAAPELLLNNATPQSPEDLKSLPWLGVLQPHFYARSHFRLSRGDEELEVELQPVLLLDTITALREAALAGAGFTMLPEWMAARDIARGTLVRLAPDWALADFDLSIAYAVDRNATGRLRAFIDFASEEIPKLFADLDHSPMA